MDGLYKFHTFSAFHAIPNKNSIIGWRWITIHTNNEAKCLCESSLSLLLPLSNTHGWLAVGILSWPCVKCAQQHYHLKDALLAQLMIRTQWLLKHLMDHWGIMLFGFMPLWSLCVHVRVHVHVNAHTYASEYVCETETEALSCRCGRLQTSQWEQ